MEHQRVLAADNLAAAAGGGQDRLGSGRHRSVIVVELAAEEVDATG